MTAITTAATKNDLIVNFFIASSFLRIAVQVCSEHRAQSVVHIIGQMAVLAEMHSNTWNLLNCDKAASLGELTTARVFGIRLGERLFPLLCKFAQFIATSPISW